MRCDLTDRHTDTQTNPTTVTLAAHARRGLTTLAGSLAGQPYFSYVHACAYDKWAGDDYLAGSGVSQRQTNARRGQFLRTRMAEYAGYNALGVLLQ